MKKILFSVLMTSFAFVAASQQNEPTQHVNNQVERAVAIAEITHGVDVTSQIERGTAIAQRLEITLDVDWSYCLIAALVKINEVSVTEKQQDALLALLLAHIKIMGSLNADSKKLALAKRVTIAGGSAFLGYLFGMTFSQALWGCGALSVAHGIYQLYKRRKIRKLAAKAFPDMPETEAIAFIETTFKWWLHGIKVKNSSSL